MLSLWRIAWRSGSKLALGGAAAVLCVGAGLCLPTVVAGGCATVPPGRAGSPATDAERMVVDLRAKNGGYARRIDELENRIFLLEDQLDSRKLAAEQQAPAVLPARPLHSDRKEAADGEPGASATDGLATAVGETSIVAEHTVEFTGDAVQPSPGTAAQVPGVGTGARPHLQLRGRTWSDAPEPWLDDGASRARTSPTEALKGYRGALELLRAGHPQPALVGFRRFLDENPQHDYADNAQYWIGECYYEQQQLSAAERAFRGVVEVYPRGNKVPDAMLKLGFTLQALGDDRGGRAVLESLARAFPKHEAARLASARLADGFVEPKAPGRRAGARLRPSAGRGQP